MIEHRLIERLIKILQIELEMIENTKEVDPFFIDLSVDFIRTYADQTHHGKEEDILFRELKKKDLTSEHQKVMNELIEEHKFGRKITKELFNVKERYINGDREALQDIMKKIQTLIDFYPKHIDKEDNHFFIPIMNYFSEKEKEMMLKEGQISDRRMIHRKYDNLVKDFEEMRNIPRITKQDWIERM
jgi:hemerythrin-like domain-containing protein